MNNILWYQPEVLSEQDIVILNGNRLENGIERNEAFDKLKKVADRAIGKKRPWHGYLDGYYFVKGSLEKKDERGRPLSFMFISDDEDGKKQLYKLLRDIEIDLSPETEALLQTHIVKGGHYKVILWAVVLFCIVTAVYIICNKYGK